MPIQNKTTEADRARIIGQMLDYIARQPETFQVVCYRIPEDMHRYMSLEIRCAARERGLAFSIDHERPDVCRVERTLVEIKSKDESLPVKVPGGVATFFDPEFTCYKP